MPKVSVLVPVYNVEEYLSTCMESILDQSLTDIEIICIDDGSTDHSGKILDEFAAKDERVIVVHKMNAGYGSAMNKGLEIASGEYIGIVESDDMISQEMYEVLYNKATEFNLDFVKSDAFYWYEKLHYISRIHINSVDNYYNRVLGELDRNVFFDFFMNIWTGIYKRDFLSDHDIKFHETAGASYQDNGFWVQTCVYAQRVMWINDAFYYYRQDNPESSIKSTAKMLAMSIEYEYLEQLFKNRNQKELLPYCYALKMFRHRGTYFRIADDLKEHFKNQVEEDYFKYKAYIRYNKYMDNWIRAFLYCPQDFTKELVEKKRKIRQQIHEATNVIVYGTGNYGDKVLRIFYNEGLYERIGCFAMSGNPTIHEFADKPVLKIVEACEKYPNAAVVVAAQVGTDAYVTMKENLKKLSFSKMIDAYEIIESFYVL